MRTHSDIIRERGPVAVHKALGLEPKKIHAVHSWVQRDSIPADQWAAFANAGLASLEELALAAANKAGATTNPGASDQGAAA